MQKQVVQITDLLILSFRFRTPCSRI